MANRPENNLWMGFLLGVAVGGGALYIFGTKKGRSFLKDIVENLDELEFSAEDIMADIVELINKETVGNKTQQEHEQNQSGNIDIVIDKIKHVLPISGVN